MKLSADALNNKNSRLCIIVCKNLKKEASAAKRHFAEEDCFDIFAVCRQKRILEIIKNHEYSSIRVFLCKCMKMPDIPENLKRKIQITEIKNCAEMIINPTFVRENSNRIFILPNSINKIKPAGNKRFVLLNTIAPKNSHIAPYRNKPFVEIINAGMDYFLSLIEKEIKHFKLKQNIEMEQQNLILRRKVADLSFAFDLLGNLTAMMKEKQTIENLIDLYTVIFHPISVEQISLEQFSQTHRNLMKEIRKNPGRSFLDTSDNTLYLLVSHKKQEYAIITIRGFFSGENAGSHRRYLAETMSQIAGLSIASARAYASLRNSGTIIKAERDLARRYLDIAGSIIVILDRNGRVKLINQTGLKLLGYSEEELVGKDWFETVIPQGLRKKLRRTHSLLLKGLLTRNTRSVENPVITSSGKQKIIMWTNTVITDRFKRISGTLSSGIDITERKLLEEKLRTLSLMDDLTGLYNRRGFFMLAEYELKRSKRTGRAFHLAFVDIDGLKEINDTSGHRMGDMVLKETAAILRNVFRKSDIIGRVGGDEFLVLPPEATGDNADVLKKRFINGIEKHNKRRSGRNFDISLSIGILKYDPSQEKTIDELVTEADMLMYEEKKKNSTGSKDKKESGKNE